ERHVVVALADTQEDGSGVCVLERDVVAFLFEDDLPQVRGSLALRPAVEDADREFGLVAGVTGVAGVPAVGVGGARAESQEGDGAQGDAGTQSLVHSVSFRLPCCVGGDWGCCVGPDLGHAEAGVDTVPAGVSPAASGAIADAALAV